MGYLEVQWVRAGKQKKEKEVITKVHCWASHHKRLLKWRNFLRSLMEWTSEADTLREPPGQKMSSITPEVFKFMYHEVSIVRSRASAEWVPASVTGQREFNMAHRGIPITTIERHDSHSYTNFRTCLWFGRVELIIRLFQKFWYEKAKTWKRPFSYYQFYQDMQLPQERIILYILKLEKYIIDVKSSNMSVYQFVRNNQL